MAPTHIKRFVAFREKEKLYHYALVPTVSSLFKEPHMRSYTYFGSVGILYSFFFLLSLFTGASFLHSTSFTFTRFAVVCLYSFHRHFDTLMPFLCIL